ncbi:hypothetical protein JNUCC64_06200 [Streptomyces sp. JNUCC 64]
MRDGLHAGLRPCVLAALLFSLHLFTPVSPLATAHVSERVARTWSGADSAPSACPVSPATAPGPGGPGGFGGPDTTTARGEGRGSSPARAAGWAALQDRLGHEPPVEEPVRMLRARDRCRGDEGEGYAPRCPLAPDPLGSDPATAMTTAPTAGEPSAEWPAVRLRPAGRAAALQVFRC